MVRDLCFELGYFFGILPTVPTRKASCEKERRAKKSCQDKMNRVTAESSIVRHRIQTWTYLLSVISSSFLVMVFLAMVLKIIAGSKGFGSFSRFWSSGWTARILILWLHCQRAFCRELLSLFTSRDVLRERYFCHQHVALVPKVTVDLPNDGCEWHTRRSRILIVKTKPPQKSEIQEEHYDPWIPRLHHNYFQCAYPCS